MTDTIPTARGFFAVVELLGHRRVAGYVTEVLLAGHRLLRIGPGPEDLEVGSPAASMFGGGAIYGIHPCSEQAARRARSDAGESPAAWYERLTSTPALPAHEDDEIPFGGEVEPDEGPGRMYVDDDHDPRRGADDDEEPCATCDKVIESMREGLALSTATDFERGWDNCARMVLELVGAAAEHNPAPQAVVGPSLLRPPLVADGGTAPAPEAPNKPQGVA